MNEYSASLWDTSIHKVNEQRVLSESMSQLSASQMDNEHSASQMDNEHSASQ